MPTGTYLDDLEVGRQYVSPTRTVTEADLVLFAGLTGDYNELHTSREFALTTQFGRPIAHGLLGLSYAHGLMARTGILEGTGIAFLGIGEWQFKAPIYAGDTIHVLLNVRDLHVSKSKPDRGVAVFFVAVVNQEGVVVQEGLKNIMMRRQPHQ
jgi:acyl dehydratase